MKTTLNQQNRIKLDAQGAGSDDQHSYAHLNRHTLREGQLLEFFNNILKVMLHCNRLTFFILR